MRFMQKVRIKMVKEEELDYGVNVIKSPKDVYEMMKLYMDSPTREMMVVICLDIKNQVNCINTVSIGGISSSIAHPREIFMPAILSNSVAIILSHNHPSGIPTPSQDDISLTKKMMEAGKILSIDVLDHVIIGDETYCSLREEGRV